MPKVIQKNQHSRGLQSPVRFDGFQGADGLVAAVIGQALNDAIAGPCDEQIEALDYLTGPWAKHHFEVLDLRRDPFIRFIEKHATPAE